MTYTKRKNPFYLRLWPVIAVISLLVFSGCGSSESSVTETEAPSYTVRYLVGKSLVETQFVSQGEYPEAVFYTKEGFTFSGWEDNLGQSVSPENIAIHRDTEYHARLYPKLTTHMPYLFPDEDGLLWPDQPLTAEALSEAIYALSASDEVADLDLPAGNDPLSVTGLRYYLSDFFPGNSLSGFEQFDQEAEISRAQFAVLFNDLLGRSGDEVVTVRAHAELPSDLSPGRSDYSDLLEATISHVPDEWGETWKVCNIPSRYAPGPVLIDGRLYWIDENGCFLRDADVNGLHFDQNGVYTSGDAELDGYVGEVLQNFISNQFPEADRLTLLRDAYNYTVESFTYLRKDAFAYGAADWEIESALEMFSTQRGNCYNYAAVFWAFARGLGYDAKAWSGTITATNQPHGWVEIEMDGVNFIFDPESQMAYHERGDYSKDMFMLSADRARGWNFRRPQ